MRQGPSRGKQSEWQCRWTDAASGIPDTSIYPGGTCFSLQCAEVGVAELGRLAVCTHATDGRGHPCREGSHFRVLRRFRAAPCSAVSFQPGRARLRRSGGAGAAEYGAGLSPRVECCCADTLDLPWESWNGLAGNREVNRVFFPGNGTLNGEPRRVIDCSIVRVVCSGHGRRKSAGRTGGCGAWRTMTSWRLTPTRCS